VQKNEESSFLPGSSESVRELTLAKRFPSGERFAAITVVRRDGGLKPRDLAAIERTRASLSANPPVTGSRQGLTEAEAARRLAESGRSYASIVRANVFTVFNVIIAAFGAVTLSSATHATRCFSASSSADRVGARAYGRWRTAERQPRAHRRP
jgi:hypothetical protein